MSLFRKKAGRKSKPKKQEEEESISPLEEFRRRRESLGECQQHRQFQQCVCVCHFSSRAGLRSSWEDDGNDVPEPTKNDRKQSFARKKSSARKQSSADRDSLRYMKQESHFGGNIAATRKAVSAGILFPQVTSNFSTHYIFRSYTKTFMHCIWIP